MLSLFSGHKINADLGQKVVLLSMPCQRQHQWMISATSRILVRGTRASLFPDWSCGELEAVQLIQSRRARRLFCRSPPYTLCVRIGEGRATRCLSLAGGGKVAVIGGKKESHSDAMCNYCAWGRWDHPPPISWSD